MKKLAAVTTALISSALWLAPAATADTLDAVCPDPQWMKVSTDAATGQHIVCAGKYPDPNLTWKAIFNDLPMVGAAGSSCAGMAPFTLGQSSDGYVVWCYSGGTALMPGMKQVDVSSPVWSLYSP